MKVKVFKMINGEELIAEIFNYYDSTVELKNPAQIILQRTESGGMGVGIAPYMPYASGNVSLYKNAIAADCEPDQNLVNEYNRIFGSGIQVAPASALSGLQMP
jgi:hypothetical protein